MIALKLRSLPRARSGCSTDAGSFASVKTKASMVAISGAIMPEPLAIPLTVTSAPPMRTRRVAPLGKVSVVMIAAAAPRQSSSPRSAFRPSKQPISFSSGRVSPMTPVEATKTSRLRQPIRPRSASIERATESSPARPVKALALPALTSRARARPPASACRHHSTGTDAVFERVRTPATLVPGAKSKSATSLRPR